MFERRVYRKRLMASQDAVMMSGYWFGLEIQCELKFASSCFLSMVKESIHLLAVSWLLPNIAPENKRSSSNSRKNGILLV